MHILHRYPLHKLRDQSTSQKSKKTYRVHHLPRLQSLLRTNQSQDSSNPVQLSEKGFLLREGEEITTGDPFNFFFPFLTSFSAEIDMTSFPHLYFLRDIDWNDYLQSHRKKKNSCEILSCDASRARTTCAAHKILRSSSSSAETLKCWARGGRYAADVL